MVNTDNSLSIVRLLSQNELGFVKCSYTHRMKTLKLKVCDPKVTYVTEWQKKCKSFIAYETDKLFIMKLDELVCYCINGRKNKPHVLYTINMPQKQKIQDLLILELPAHNDYCNIDQFRPSILVLASGNWLYRFDIETGRMLQSIYIGNKDYKFCSLGWDDTGHTITIRTTRPMQDSNKLFIIGYFSVYPLEFIGICPILKSTFGKRITNLMIQDGILMMQYSSGSHAKLKFYNWKAVVDKNKLYTAVLNKFSTQMKGVPGTYPDGLPINVDFKEKTDMLFAVKSNDNHLRMGGRPWHYITISPSNIFSNHVSSFSTRQILKGGILTQPITQIEKTEVYFHPDDSSRIIMQAPDYITVFNIERSVLVPKFTIEQDKSGKRILNELNYVTKSGRKVKRKFSHQHFVDQSYDKRLLAVDCEIELELIYCLFNDGNGRLVISIYSDTDGNIIKNIQVETEHLEGTQHTIQAEGDLLVHIYKSAYCSTSSTCVLYKLGRSRIFDSEELL